MKNILGTIYFLIYLLISTIYLLKYKNILGTIYL